MTTEERQAISRASIEAHQAARDRAISEKIWVFDETIPATGLSGGMIVAPDGESIAYVFTYRDGWRDRVNALIESANRRSPETVEAVRAEITRLEGELSRLSGRPLLIRDGMNGGTTYNDIPPGGALLDFETGIAEQTRREWYPDLESARAALASLWREHKGELAPNGLNLNADPIHAYITRRDTTKGAGK